MDSTDGRGPEQSDGAAVPLRRFLMSTGLDADMRRGREGDAASVAVVEEGVGGGGGGRKVCNGGGDGRRDANAYYRRMIQADPANPLLLGNYARFLKEVEGDAARAQEYWERAIVANPGDGDALALYAGLVWETTRDADRADAYFTRAVHAAPDDW
jgi:tetratricopeptide (TPR) repeat protein